jgi:hypothetical protein
VPQNGTGSFEEEKKKKNRKRRGRDAFDGEELHA